MTNFNDLDEDEQELVLQELQDEPPELQQCVEEGHYCASCFMVYYNCLCSHDDD